MLSRFLYTIAFLLLNLLNLTAGEGSKPIFDREEIKRAIGETKEDDEHRTVVIVNLENSENKLKRNSACLSPTRTRHHRPRRTWSRHPRFSSDREKGHSRERKDGKISYRDYRERPRDHSRDGRQTGRSREGDRPREQRIQPILIYYGNFQPRPLMVQPWGPIRGPLGGTIPIHPPIMYTSRYVCE